jgi:hypothetical protein
MALTKKAGTIVSQACWFDTFCGRFIMWMLLVPYFAIVLAIAVGVVCFTQRNLPPHQGFSV